MRIFVLNLLLLAACGGDATGTGVPCTGTESRCDGNRFQTCRAGEFFNSETCAGTTVCAEDLGCVGCDPSVVGACVGDDLHRCGADGAVGDFIQSCEAGCNNGFCGDDCQTDGADLVYLVDDDFRLYSFDPRRIGTAEDPYREIGVIDCPAVASWPAWTGGNPASPFSMSVDRSGRAWILYTSGEIFFVSPRDLTCELSWFSRGAEGFELFGMGFTADTSAGSSETLFLAGGGADQVGIGDLGAVDPVARTIVRRGPLTTTFDATVSPEMTGTGAGELFAYFPGVDAHVVRLDKTTGNEMESWDVPDVIELRGWAFAHWGGEFYIFITRNTGVSEVADVQRLNINTGVTETVLSDTGRIIVGAGVSTCAPTTPIQ